LPPNKTQKNIYAIDHSDFISIASKIAQHNNFNNIEFIQTNSRDFETEVKFDALIHEQIGDYLFNENMIEKLLDLKNRLLKPNGRIFAGKFELYLEPVALKEEFNVPFIWENQIDGIDFTFLREYYEEWLGADVVKKFLCAPLLFYSFI